MDLLEGKLALKMSVFGGQEDVSYCWTHIKKFILKICRRKEHDLPRIRERKQCTTS